MKKNEFRYGFTLVEIMIVVMILGILTSVALMGYSRSRPTTQKNVCIANLREMYTAIQSFAANQNKERLSPVTMDDIVPDYIRNIPKCPAGGSYTLMTVDEDPKCSLGDSDGHHL